MSISGPDRPVASAAADAAPSVAPPADDGSALRVGRGGGPTHAAVARAAAGPAAGEDEGAWANATADRLRNAPDAEKTGLLNDLEVLGNSRTHEGWAAVYDNPQVVAALAGVVNETLDPSVQGRATSFLLKVYRDHFDDDGDNSSALKNAATEGLVAAYGSEVFATTLRMTGDDRLARAISDRAESTLDDPLIRAGENTPLLEKMGIDGSGAKVMVIDSAGSDHMAHTTYLASPARSGSEVVPSAAPGPSRGAP